MTKQSHSPDTQALQPELVRLVRVAGTAILAVYETDFQVMEKQDESPLTKADLAAHRVIVEGLGKLTPDVPVLSEESRIPEFAVRSHWPCYWLVDPLDGTKEFVNRNGEFTVNIALIDGGRPRFGVVGVPVRDQVYVGDVDAGVALRFDGESPQTIHSRTMQGDSVTVVASRNHGGARLEAYLSELGKRFSDVVRTPVGSSLKLCILAEGRADLYPRLGLTSEWDIAAAHAVLVAAGGDLWALDGSPMTYNAKDSVLNPEFVAVADAQYPWRTQLPGVPEDEV